MENHARQAAVSLFAEARPDNVLRTTKLRAALVAAAAIVATTLGASAAQAQPQSGLVNVAIGDITIEDVAVGVAANILANVCGVQVNAAVIAQQVIRNDEQLVGTCTNRNNAPFTITQ